MDSVVPFVCSRRYLFTYTLQTAHHDEHDRKTTSAGNVCLENTQKNENNFFLSLHSAKCTPPFIHILLIKVVIKFNIYDRLLYKSSNSINKKPGNAPLLRLICFDMFIYNLPRLIIALINQIVDWIYKLHTLRIDKTRKIKKNET